MTSLHYSRETMQAYLQDWLDEEQSLELEAHIPECLECRAFLQRCAKEGIAEHWSAAAHGEAWLEAALLNAGDALPEHTPLRIREALARAAGSLGRVATTVVSALRTAPAEALSFVPAVVGRISDKVNVDWSLVPSPAHLSPSLAKRNPLALRGSGTARALFRLTSSGELVVTLSGLPEGDMPPLVVALHASDPSHTKVVEPVWEPHADVPGWVAKVGVLQPPVQLVLIRSGK